MTREEMIEALSSNTCVVNFTKKDGEIREMTCTRNMNVIPKEKHPKGSGLHERVDTAIAAWDTNKGEWRAFVVANVNSFEVM